MCAANQQTRAGRIVGVQSESGRNPSIEAWKSPDEATVDAMPPLRLPRSLPAREETSEWAPSTPVLPPALPEGIAEASTHAYLFFHARETAAVARTIMRREQGGDDGGTLASLSAEELVAAILIGLGQEIGAAVCKQLANDEIQWVTSAIAETHEVGHQLSMQALEMVHQRIISGDYVEVGGPEFARGMLMKAIGPYRANHFVDRSKQPTESGFEMLNRVEAGQIAPFISNEHPQTIALILTQLKPPKAAAVLAQLPQRLQADVSYRMATTENVVQTVIGQVEEALEASFSDLLGSDREVGGPKVMADVLNLTGSSVEKNVLDQMDAQDSEVAESVRNLMFIFSDIGKMTDREMQTLLRETEEKDLAIALRPADAELRERFLSNMSEQARISLQDSMASPERMLRRDVEEVQLRIVQEVRRLEEQGKVVIVRGVSDDAFV